MSDRRRRARSWLLQASLALALGAVAALGADLAWRSLRWGALLADARFVDHPEKVSGGGAAVTVTGYLVATIVSDVDFFALARAEGARPKVHAALCDSGREVAIWHDPLPQEAPTGGKAFAYAVLVPLRGAGGRTPGASVDLGAGAEDVCLRFQAATMAPLSWMPSRRIAVPLRGELRRQIESYSRRDGDVRIVLDPGCAPQLCEPGFSARDLLH